MGWALFSNYHFQMGVTAMGFAEHFGQYFPDFPMEKYNQNWKTGKKWLVKILDDATRSYLWVKRTHTHVCLQQNEEAIFSHKTSWRASHDDPIILTCATTLVSHFSNNYGLHITIYCSYTANKNSRKCSRTAIFLCADSFCSLLLEKRPWRQIKKKFYKYKLLETFICKLIPYPL